MQIATKTIPKAYKASIIIPTYNRQELTNRAIKSVINSTGSENTQIIVIDDCSQTPFIPTFLRNSDLLIKNLKNMGASACRHTGLQKATGEIIYFLDSDDYYIKKNFETDYEKIIKNKNALYYCDFMYGKKTISKIPNEIAKKDYFDFIFNLYPGIANTCSLCFHKSVKQNFDLTLERHQDWDFVHSFLKNGLPLKKISGIVFIDRSDKHSISRNKNYKKSLPWLNKLREIEGHDIYMYAKYWALSKYPECMPLPEFVYQSYYYLKLKKIKTKFIFKRFLQRFL